MSVHKKLMQARIKLQAAKLSKTGHNKFAGYQYFELGDFLPTVQNIFAELGLCGTVSYTADTAKLTITDTDGGGEIVITSPMGSAALKGCHEVQNIGAVETYQRRYLWVTAMEIVEHDALDATTGKDEPKRGAITPIDGALAALSADEQQTARKAANTIVDLWNAEQEFAAYEAYYQQGYSNELMLGIWEVLKPHSAIRNKLKAMHKDTKHKEAA